MAEATRNSPLRLVLLTGLMPAYVARFARRLKAELPEAALRGIVYELPRPKSFRQRLRLVWKNLRQRGYPAYLLERLFRASAVRLFYSAAEWALRLMHACPKNPNALAPFSPDDLAALCRELGCEFHATRAINSPETRQFVASLQPDLGLVNGTGILQPELFNLPRLGSINIHKHKVPAYRGGGPPGLWELLAGDREVGITIHKVEAEVDAGAIVRQAGFPIQDFDTLESLRIKADVLGDDLLIETLRDYARGAPQLAPQPSGGRTFRGPKPHQMRLYRRQLAARNRYRPALGRPLYKLLARFLLFAPAVLARNWKRRRRRTFPVVILFHHLIADRPHRLGTPTEAFFRQVKYLQRHYRIVSLREALRLLEGGQIDRPTIVLTFDDGYADNFVTLRGIVQELGVPVTLFASSGHVATGKPFPHDVRDGLAGFAPLSWEQLAQLARQGFEIGSHTRSHCDCGALEGEALRQEIEGSRRELEARLERPVDLFSFPWGLPENMPAAAIEVALRAYAFVFAACGTSNAPGPAPCPRLLLRCPFPRSTLELELALQEKLDLERVPAAWREPARPAEAGA